MRFELIGKPEGCKLLRMSLDIEPPILPTSTINAISIRGDFFAIPEEAFDELLGELSGVTIDTFVTRFEELARQKHIEFEGINSKGLMELIEKQCLRKGPDYGV